MSPLSLLVRGEGPKSLTPEGVSYIDFDCGSGLHRREVLRLRLAPRIHRAKNKEREASLRMTGWVAGEEARDTPLGMTGGVGHDVTAKFARARQGPKSLTPEGVSYMDFDCGSVLHRREVLR